MARARTRAEEPDDDDDEEVDEGARDYALARIGGAIAAAQNAVTALTEAAHGFVDPSADKKGKERKEALEAALESLGLASRATELAQGALEEMDDEELETSETDVAEED